MKENVCDNTSFSVQIVETLLFLRSNRWMIHLPKGETNTKIDIHNHTCNVCPCPMLTNRVIGPKFLIRGRHSLRRKNESF